MNLTPKQEAFCLAYIELGNASDAYREAYNTSRMKSTTVNRCAAELLDNPKITARIEELRAPAREKAELTLESHLERLDSLSRAAEEAGQYSAAITSEISRGRAAGLYKERLEHTGPEGEGPRIIELVPMTPDAIKRVMAEDDC